MLYFTTYILHSIISYVNVCLLVVLDKYAEPAKLTMSSSNDVMQLKQVARNAGSLVRLVKHEKWNHCQPLSLSSDAVPSSEASTKVQY